MLWVTFGNGKPPLSSSVLGCIYNTAAEINAAVYYIHLFPKSIRGSIPDLLGVRVWLVEMIRDETSPSTLDTGGLWVRVWYFFLAGNNLVATAGSGLEPALTFDEPHLFEHFLAGPMLLIGDSYLSIHGVAFWLWVLWGRIRLMKWAGGRRSLWSWVTGYHSGPYMRVFVEISGVWCLLNCLLTVYSLSTDWEVTTHPLYIQLFTFQAIPGVLSSNVRCLSGPLRLGSIFQHFLSISCEKSITISRVLM